MATNERLQFVRLLYESLPDKTRIVEGRAVKAIVTSPDGVHALLCDGTMEK